MIGKSSDIFVSNDPDLRGSVAAMKRAAAAARELAIRTGTDLIVGRDGKMVRITAAELRAEDEKSKSRESASS